MPKGAHRHTGDCLSGTGQQGCRDTAYVRRGALRLSLRRNGPMTGESRPLFCPGAKRPERKILKDGKNLCSPACRCPHGRQRIIPEEKFAMLFMLRGKSGINNVVSL